MPQEKIKSWLCKKPQAGTGIQDTVDTADKATTAADAARGAAAAAAAAVGVSRTPFAQAGAFLGRTLTTALSRVGELGKGTTLVGVALSLRQGDYQSAAYAGVDYLVYGALAEAGILGAPETLGASAATATMVATTYYTGGGSRGMVQSALGCP